MIIGHFCSAKKLLVGKLGYKGKAVTNSKDEIKWFYDGSYEKNIGMKMCDDVD